MFTLVDHDNKEHLGSFDGPAPHVGAEVYLGPCRYRVERVTWDCRGGRTANRVYVNVFVRRFDPETVK